MKVNQYKVDGGGQPSCLSYFVTFDPCVNDVGDWEQTRDSLKVKASAQRKSLETDHTAKTYPMTFYDKEA